MNIMLGLQEETDIISIFTLKDILRQSEHLWIYPDCSDDYSNFLGLYLFFLDRNLDLLKIKQWRMTRQVEQRTFHFFSFSFSFMYSTVETRDGLPL